MALTTIQFTQEQARSLAHVTAGDLRHWRKAVPYLASKPGKAARFSFTDLIGLAVTSELIQSFGVHIRAIGGGVDRLFHILAQARPAQIEDAVAVVTTEDALLYPVGDGAWRNPGQATLIVPCRPLITRMRDQMVPFSEQIDQASLPFPPQMVRTGR